MRKLSAAAVCAALGGCVSAQPSAPQFDIEQAMQACHRPSRSHVQVALCENKVFQRVGGSGVNSDLVNLAVARNLVVAEKLDRREISEAEGQLELAQSASLITSEVGRRNSLAASQAAAEDAAQAARVQAAAAAFQQSRPVPPAPAFQPVILPQDTRCVTNLVGNTAFTNCH